MNFQSGLKGEPVLVRTQNCILNTDNITFATYSRTITTLGTGGPVATPIVLEIHFTGTENKTFKGGEAETLWGASCQGHSAC